MRSWRHWLSALSLWIVFGPLAGCGDNRPARAPVEGRITVGGQPLASGRIMFWPDEGVPARGQIGPDGVYRLSTFGDGDGAVLGRHVVTIEATQIENPGPQLTSLEQEIEYYGDPAHAKDVSQTPAVRWLVPERYSQRETSELSADVLAKRPNRIDFDLPGS